MEYYQDMMETGVFKRDYGTRVETLPLKGSVVGKEIERKVRHWQLKSQYLAKEFKAAYSIKEEGGLGKLASNLIKEFYLEVCSLWKEIAKTMRDKIYTKDEEHLIDVFDIQCKEWGFLLLEMFGKSLGTGDYGHLTIEHAPTLFRNHRSFYELSNQGFEAAHKLQRQLYLKATSHDRMGYTSSLDQILTHLYCENLLELRLSFREAVRCSKSDELFYYRGCEWKPKKVNWSLEDERWIVQMDDLFNRMFGPDVCTDTRKIKACENNDDLMIEDFDFVSDVDCKMQSEYEYKEVSDDDCSMDDHNSELDEVQKHSGNAELTPRGQPQHRTFNREINWLSRFTDLYINDVKACLSITNINKEVLRHGSSIIDVHDYSTLACENHLNNFVIDTVCYKLADLKQPTAVIYLPTHCQIWAAQGKDYLMNRMLTLFPGGFPVSSTKIIITPYHFTNKQHWGLVCFSVMAKSVFFDDGLKLNTPLAVQPFVENVLDALYLVTSHPDFHRKKWSTSLPLPQLNLPEQPRSGEGSGSCGVGVVLAIKDIIECQHYHPHFSWTFCNMGQHRKDLMLEVIQWSKH